MRRIGLCLLALQVVLLPACSFGHLDFLGYTTTPNYDMSIRSVYVPMVKNKAFVHGSIEFDVTRAIINEIQLRTPYKVFETISGADTELICTIAKRDKMVINQNQLGENREAQFQLVFEVLWLDRRPGHEGEVLSGNNARKLKEGETPKPPVLSPDGKVKPDPAILSPTAFFIPELGGSITTAQADVIKGLARQVANMMEVTGKAWR